MKVPSCRMKKKRSFTIAGWWRSGAAAMARWRVKKMRRCAIAGCRRSGLKAWNRIVFCLSPRIKIWYVSTGHTFVTNDNVMKYGDIDHNETSKRPNWTHMWPGFVLPSYINVIKSHCFYERPNNIGSPYVLISDCNIISDCLAHLKR